MTRWPSRDRRARVAAVVAKWFSPQQWPLNDQIIAVAATALAVSVFLPWYKAVVHLRNYPLNGFLIHPRGTASGLTVHEYLWAIFGLALLQLLVLTAHHAPARRGALTIPGYRPTLLVTSAMIFGLALIAIVLKPRTWYGRTELAGGLFHIGVGLDYGAVAAVIASIALLVVSWTVLRDPAAT